MQASVTILKGMHGFAGALIGEGPPVEDRGIYFQGVVPALCALIISLPHWQQ